ncbi:MAG: DUF1700 domain-containing protein [Lachnospiraceae bacterium]|nr:DUF1700 domain-containing protein [Lachnospiraceae bacterium]
MEKQIKEYLMKIDQYLKPMPASDRADIIKEIESNMMDMKTQEGLTEAEIVKRMGSPKLLAKAYLSDTIIKSQGISLKKFGALFAFCSVVGLTGMIVLPGVGVTAVALLLSGVVTPVAGLMKLVAALFGIDIPFIVFQIGNYTAPPVLVFVFSLMTGIVLFAAGWGLWKVTKVYIRVVGSGFRKLTATDI